MNSYPELPPHDAAHGFSKLYGEESMHIYADTVRAVDAQWNDMESVPHNKPVLLAICVSRFGRGYHWEIFTCEVDDAGNVTDARFGDPTGWDFDDYQGWRDLPAPPPPEVEA